MVILNGLIRVNAATVAVSNAKFNLYTAISRDEKLCAKPTSYGYKNIDTNINTTDRPYVNHIDYLFETNLRAGQSYTITFVQSYNPKTDVVARPDGISYRLEGSTTTNDSGLSANNISSFKCFLTNDTNNNVKVNVTCNVVPLNNVKKIWISQTHNYCGTYIKGFNTYFLEVNQNSATEDAINRQTEIIKDGQDKIIKGQEKTNEILSKDHKYDTNPSESTENEKKEMEKYEKEEDSLRNGLNLSIEESEITINPEANTFIWNVVDKLRGMSSKIVLLFTSVLSLGIMKMVLGR